MPDNWKHRSDNMRCKACMYFVAKQKKVDENDLGDELFEEQSLGRCRRHAPTMGGWPAVFGTDWCGDHKLDENRL